MLLQKSASRADSSPRSRSHRSPRNSCSSARPPHLRQPHLSEMPAGSRTEANHHLRFHAKPNCIQVQTWEPSNRCTCQPRAIRIGLHPSFILTIIKAVKICSRNDPGNPLLASSMRSGIGKERPIANMRWSGGGFQRRHVHHKAVFDVVLQHPVIGLVDVLHGDHLDVRNNAMLGAEIQHLLGLGNAADQ
jgi:hypothetical protein